jgi:hypothetical protein
MKLQEVIFKHPLVTMHITLFHITTDLQCSLKISSSDKIQWQNLIEIPTPLEVLATSVALDTPEGIAFSSSLISRTKKSIRSDLLEEDDALFAASERLSSGNNLIRQIYNKTSFPHLS